MIISINEASKILNLLNSYGVIHPSLDSKLIENLFLLQKKLLTINNQSLAKINVPVAIIGSGISGQYAAFILTKLGFSNITILEAEKKFLGGRTSSVTLNGYICLPGAMRIPRDYLTDHLIKFLEIPTQTFYNETNDSLVLSVNKNGKAIVMAKKEALSTNLLKNNLLLKWETELQYIASFLDKGVSWLDIINTLSLDKYTLKEYLTIKREWSNAEYTSWSGSPLGDYNCFESSGVLAWEIFGDHLLNYERKLEASNIANQASFTDEDMYTVDDIKQIPFKLFTLNQKHNVKQKFDCKITKIFSKENQLILIDSNQNNFYFDYCFDTTPPHKSSGINIECSQKIFIDVSYPTNHILSNKFGSKGKFYILDKLRTYFSKHGFGDLYIFKHITENRCILMSYSWGNEARITYHQDKKSLPLALFNALTIPIPGTIQAIFPELIFNGGIATPVEKAFRMTTKNDLFRGYRFSPLNKEKNPYISTLANGIAFPGLFSENEWVSVAPGFIRTALFTALKFCLNIYVKTCAKENYCHTQ
ncbi:MAG: NAD(P)-binding protein [Pseudomonadota bacterium]